ncbi:MULTISPECIES: hypothetical protein [unclassified Curtobacterium]|uniref:hypothetical protein n=1 Tax=unclassified Curtobacterium TaxID=257496 RepID=UPI000DAA2DB5|nr:MULTISPECIES: hypothetical protein [unclassified Curtobacterium]PZF41753.1 hypothetical protein DEJ07_07685 [Curtobacterium sp. MCLR17_053]PZF52048.1 hypothetical protein DEJ06_07440 [Curtobacterium sp. MCLR17_051]
MELLNDLRSNWTIIVAKIVLLVLLALCWYNVASFTQSTSQAVAQGLSADADVDLYTVVDDLGPDAFETIRRDEHALDAVASFADRIDDQPGFDFISSYDQPVTVQDFRGDDRFDVGYGTEYTLNGKYQDESGRSVQDIKSIQLNETAYEFAGLSVQDGKPIEWDGVDWGSGRIPVLLGNEYRGVYELGERFTGAVILQEQELEVVGFLEPDSAMYFRGEPNHYLDDTVIVPYPPTLAGLDRAALDRVDPELFGRLVFQVLNADLAVDHSLDFGGVVARLDAIGDDTGFRSYTLLGVPSYLVQLSLVRQLVQDNVALVTALLVVLTASVGIITAFLHRLLHNRRAPVARVHHLLGRSPDATNRLFRASRLTEYTAALGLFLTSSALLPNDSAMARLGAGTALLLWCVADGALGRRAVRIELTTQRRRGTPR